MNIEGIKGKKQEARSFRYLLWKKPESVSWRMRSRGCFFHGELSFNDEVYITNARHKEALEAALRSLRMVRSSVLDGMPEDFLFHRSCRRL